MGNRSQKNEPKPPERDPQTLSIFIILGLLTVMVLVALRWVLFVPAGPVARPPAAIQGSKTP